MTRAMEIVSQMQQLTEELNLGSSELYKQLSELDKQMNQIYHEAEVVALNKDNSHELMMKLQSVARKRREVKMEIACFEQASRLLECNDKFKDKLYNVKSRLDKKESENLQYAYWLKEDSNTYIEA